MIKRNNLQGFTDNDSDAILKYDNEIISHIEIDLI
jgi:hypothetical protein